MECPDCQRQNPEDSKFCNECGHQFAKTLETSKSPKSIASERKHVTVMFSDMSGYTALTECLDPEEVKKIMSDIFGKITTIIKSYDGYIERFIGDAVMAVFGVPKAHEDDPIRAIRAALDIHTVVEDFSPQFVEKIGRSLAMHTGINTGLVVTGEVDLEKGTHGLTGDAINLAARLEELSKAGEIVVGPDTFQQALNYFEFEALEPAKIKGKTKPVSIYKLKSVKKEFVKTHRLQGQQAALTGRNREMEILTKAVERLKRGQGSIITICGDAGTGKSRLKSELKTSLEINDIEWREGHAYSYTQNMPYYPLINLLTHAFHIDEGDATDAIRVKVENGISFLLGKGQRYIPYIGSLFALTYSEIEDVSPDFWKDKLGESVQELISALVHKSPTIICFEDLHWADNSFIELLKHLLEANLQKALFICTFRSYFSLFEETPPSANNMIYQEIKLKELTTLDANKMLKSLLNTQSIPEELDDIVQKKAEGNPFYIEEIINSLIDRQVLIRNRGNWNFSRKITDSDVPATIQGVLTARVDRLEKHFKRILQEASVIGRTFLHKILLRITDLDRDIDQYLTELNRLDLIRTQSQEPEIEYIFKHALTQEVVYNGLLIKDRRKIHERIGIAIEVLFSDRLAEFYETLAFHFSLGNNPTKAIEYLLKAGEKSLSKYAVDQAHHYYKDALEVFEKSHLSSDNNKSLLFEILIKWGFVYYYRGDFKGGLNLYLSYESMADSIDDKTVVGMYYVWLGHFLFEREQLIKSYYYLKKAIKLGEDIDDAKIVGYASTWLTWNCAELGEFEEGLSYGKKAQEILKESGSDHLLFHESIGGMGQIYYYMGKWEENVKIGNKLLKYGEENSNIRCLVAGYIYLGHSHFSSGALEKAIEMYKQAIQVSADPLYSEWPRLFLGMAYVQNEQINMAEQELQKVLIFTNKYGYDYTGTAAKIFLEIISIAKGNLSKGMRNLENLSEMVHKKKKKACLSIVEYILGKIYLQFIEGSESISFSIIIKNIFFIIKMILVAKKKAEKHLKKALNLAEGLGSPGTKGQIYLELGLLYKKRKEKDKANQFINNSILLFKETNNTFYLKQARDALKSAK